MELVHKDLSKVIPFWQHTNGRPGNRTSTFYSLLDLFRHWKLTSIAYGGGHYVSSSVYLQAFPRWALDELKKETFFFGCFCSVIRVFRISDVCVCVVS